MQVYNAHGEPALCKLGTSVPIEGYEIPILGVFNVGKEGPLSEFISLETFPNLDLNETYIIRAHSTGHISAPVRLHTPIPRIFLDLPFWGWEVLSAFPIRTFLSPCPNDTTVVAILGLQHKITGAAAITNLTLKPLEDSKGVKIQVSLKALGVLGQPIFPGP